MNIKIYKFSYGGALKKVISKTISLMYNAMIGGFILLIYISIIAEINYKLKYLIDDSVLIVFRVIAVCLGIIILLYFIIPSFFQQKVEISERIVNIYRHCLFFSVFMIFRGFNDTILINQIEKVYKPTSKEKFFEPIPVNVIDWNNMVIIQTKSKSYYAPVENSDEFIEEINKRRCELQGEIRDDSLC